MVTQVSAPIADATCTHDCLSCHTNELTGDIDDEIEDTSDNADDRALKFKHTAAASKRAVAVRQPRRGRGGISSPELDESDSAADDDNQQDDGNGGSGKTLDINAFAYNGKGAPAPSAGKQGKSAKSTSNSPATAENDAATGQGRGRSGRGSRAASPETIESLTAALDAEEAEAADVADASEFAPRTMQRLANGADVDKILAVRYQDDGAMEALVKLVGEESKLLGVLHLCMWGVAGCLCADP